MGYKRHFSQGGRHESGKQRRDERLMRKTIKSESVVVIDKSIPLIDIGIERINKIIKSAIEPSYEDAIQDVWVRILDGKDNIGSEGDILKLAKEINHKYASNIINATYKLKSLDNPLKINNGDSTDNTYINILPSPSLYNYDLFSKILSSSQSKYAYTESQGQCILCHKKNEVLLNYLCEYCWQYYLDSRNIDIPTYKCISSRIDYYKKHMNQPRRILHTHHSNHKDGQCYKCNRKAIPSLGYCLVHLQQIEREELYKQIYYRKNKLYFQNYNKQYNNLRYKQKTNTKQCLKCDKPALTSHKYCAFHLLEKRGIYRPIMKIRYHYRKDNHICTDCGIPLDNTYMKTRCPKCLARKNELRHQHHNKITKTSLTFCMERAKVFLPPKIKLLPSVK